MWCSDDEYCQNAWDNYQRALRIIREYKDSPIEDIAFLCKYCEMEINENFKEQGENDKRFRVINLLKCERDDYIQYSKWLEERLLRLAEISNRGAYPQMVEGKKEEIFNYDYDKKYNEYKLNWVDLTRRN